MTVNLIKLCVGIKSLDELELLQARRRQQRAAAGLEELNIHITRNRPKRALEIIGKGSLYWVIKRSIVARQLILRIDELNDGEGRKRCGLVLDQKIIKTEPKPCRPFQGWRYLEASNSPRDRTLVESNGADMPIEMEEELRSLGLL